MEKLDYKIKEIISQKIAQSYEYDNAIKNTIEIISNENYSQNNNTIFYKISKIVATIITCLSVTSLAAYTAVTVYNQNITKGYVQSLIDNMITIEHNIYYKKIYSYNEYLDYLKLEKDLIMMSADDFKENFLIIVVLDSGGYDKLYIENILVENNNLNINLRKPNINNSEYVIGNYVLSSKIAKSFDKENIKINIWPNTDDMPSNYTFLENLTEEYVKEQAFIEDCIVIKNNTLLSDNKKLLETFLDNTQNNIDSAIRIVSYGNYINANIVVKDIIYKNGRYYINICNILNDGSKKMEFLSGNEIDMIILENNYIQYIIKSDYGMHHVIALFYK